MPSNQSEHLSVKLSDLFKNIELLQKRLIW